ncbi:MAG: sensor histidine kinase, partial [Candidatus Muiribacteriaceae bacterium]
PGFLFLRAGGFILILVVINLFIYILIIYMRHKIVLHTDITDDLDKDKLASSLAHELKNPLSGISMFIELMERKIKTEPETDYLRNIKKEIRNLNKIISNFINYARPFRINLRDTDIRLLVDGLIGEFSESLSDIRVDIDVKNQKIMIDPVLIRQVFINLLFNSIDALEDISDPYICIRSEKNKKGFDIIYINNGHPVLPEERERLFDPYFTTRIKGSGLGLSICRKIMHEHGGDIIFEGSDSEKTIFRLKFKEGK